MRVSLLTLCCSSMLGVVALGRQNFDLKRESGMQARKAIMLRKKQAARAMQEAQDNSIPEEMPEAPWNCMN